MGVETSKVSVGKGALGGAIAAMAMTGMRTITTELGIVKQVPPEAIVAQKTPGLFSLVPERYHTVLVETLHWAYGAGGGAAFGALPARVRAKKWIGPGYGLAVWFLFEAGIAPLLGLRQAKQPRIAERLAFAVDHILYGAIVGSRV